jgi:hypothetical protein
MVETFGGGGLVGGSRSLEVGSGGYVLSQAPSIMASQPPNCESLCSAAAFHYNAASYCRPQNTEPNDQGMKPLKL